MIYLIACVDTNNGIGLDGKIPWNVSPDMKFFKHMTTGHVVIMGRKTWESIGCNPLPNRINVVITSNPQQINNAMAFTNLQDAITYFINQTIFIIGGSMLYAEAVPLSSNIYITRLDIDAGCDTFFPYELLHDYTFTYSPWIKYANMQYRFEQYYK